MGAANFVGAGGATIGTAVKKAKGGLSEVVNIEDSFANLANKIIKLARTNELYKNIIDTGAPGRRSGQQRGRHGRV